MFLSIPSARYTDKADGPAGSLNGSAPGNAELAEKAKFAERLNALKNEVHSADEKRKTITTLYKATADFIKASAHSGFGAQMVSNSFPGASPLAKELGKEGAGVSIAQVVPPPFRQSISLYGSSRATLQAV